MRFMACFPLVTLLGCSSSVISSTADTGAASDTPALDAPAVDAPAVDRPPADRVDVPTSPVDVPSIDVPAVDIPLVVDASIDRPATDVADVADVIAPIDHFFVDAPDAPCAAPLFACGAACVDRQTDPRNCGACGNTCTAGGTCRNGSCLPCGGCAAGNVCCGAVCVNLQSDQNNCGLCGSVCAPGRPCLAGTCIADDCPGGGFCSGVCRRFDTDPAHCGACNQPCCAGNSCSAGTCVPGCAPGMTACPGSSSSCRGGICVDTRSDPAHCGSCTTACGAGETCVSGACRGSGFMALAPCNLASDYVTGSTVRFGGASGSAYSPRCLTVRVNDTVAWEGDFGSHPRSPSTRGTTTNPIARVTSGTSGAVRFTRAGFFPYFCEFHGDNAGAGMAGVVQVIE